MSHDKIKADVSVIETLFHCVTLHEMWYLIELAKQVKLIHNTVRLPQWLNPTLLQWAELHSTWFYFTIVPI